MKKSILYTVIILLIFSCSSYKKKNDLEGQNIFKNTKPFFKKKSALETKNLFGKVKSYKEFSYKAVEISGEIIKGDRKRQYSSSYDSYIKYDENGNMIEWTNYNSDGSLYIKGSNKLDEKGIFRADDEVGVIFTDIDESIDNLYEFITKYVNANQTEESKKTKD